MTRVSVAELLEPKGLSYGIVQPGKAIAEGVPIVRVSDMVDGRVRVGRPLRVGRDVDAQHVRTRLTGGEVLLSVVGTVGRVAIVPNALAGWNVARAIAVMRPKSEELGRWLRYCLEAREAQHAMGVAKTDTVQATLNLRDVAKLVIPLPGERERRRIVAVLAAFDDLVDTCKSLMGTLGASIEAEYRLATSGEDIHEAPLLTAVPTDLGAPFAGQHFTTPGVGMPLLRIRDLKQHRSDTWVCCRSS